MSHPSHEHQNAQPAGSSSTQVLDSESAAWLILPELRKHPSPPQHVVASKPLNRRANPIWSPLDCLNWTPRNPTAIIRKKQTNINIWTAKNNKT